MRILVVEDDPGLQSVLERGLKQEGYVVDVVDDGDQALLYLRTYDYEAAVMDWRLPGTSGIDVVAAARRRRIATPVLMLTARDAVDDRIAGLDAGADDYLVKPFEFGELVARLRALQRRPAVALDPELRCGDLAFDPSTRQASVGARPVSLTATEASLVEILLRRSPAVVTRRAMALHAWEDEADAVGSNTIDVHVGRLRGKLAGSTASIETVRGSGYRLVGPDG